jgi:hypothetical protein
MGAKKNTYRMLVGKLERKRPLGRSKRRWVNNIKMELGEIGWGDRTGLISHRIETSGGFLRTR